MSAQLRPTRAAAGFAAILMTGLLASACGAGSERSTEARSDTRAAAPASPPGKVVGTLEASASLKNNARTLVDLVASPELAAVVVGKVAGVAFEGDVTRLEVSVEDALRGRAGATVVVREDGGYVSAAQVSAETREKFPDSGATAGPDEWVDVPFEGASHLGIGDEVLLFLSRDHNPGREGEFQEVGSVYGRFQKGADGRYVRAGDDPEKQLTVRIDQVKQVLGRR